MLNQGSIGYYGNRTEKASKKSRKNSYEKILNLFGSRLERERIKHVDYVKSSGDFDRFIDEVLVQAQEMLRIWGVKIAYTPPGQRLGIKESWRCIKVFENHNVYYRIGKTRPRKGPYQGQKLLSLDLIMDGQKKNVFLPLLRLKKEIEIELGEFLERELPSVEATGKYRLKLFMPYRVVEKGNVKLTAIKLSSFILVTKKALNKLGVA